MGKKATIATLALRRERLGAMCQEALLSHLIDRVDELSKCSVDLICLPEEALIATGDRDNPRWREHNEALLQALCERARSRHTLIECCVEEPSEAFAGRRYNTAYLIGRDGSTLGRYRKRHLTYRALESGGLPGPCDLPLFETDIGLIGIQTCFDIGFRDTWMQLAQAGAELIIWDAAYDGGTLLNAYAAHGMTFIASSVWGDHAKIIDPLGRTLEESSCWDGVALCTVDLGMEIFHIDRQADRPSRLRRALGDRVSIHSDTQQNVFTVESNDEAWPMARICREFDLTTYRDYHAQYAQVNREWRERYRE